MADRFRWIAEDPIELSLALAVKPIDAITGRALHDEATVSIPDVHESPRLNPSGYWLFLTPPVDLPADPITVTIDAPYRYTERTETVSVGELETPALRVKLYPSTAYEFASDRTRIRGTVTDDTGEPVAYATVRIEYADPETAPDIDYIDLETRTDTDGSFVLVIDGIVSKESPENGRPLRVGIDPDDPTLVHDYSGDEPRDELTLVVEDPEDNETTIEKQIHEGERLLLESPIVL